MKYLIILFCLIIKFIYLTGQPCICKPKPNIQLKHLVLSVYYHIPIDNKKNTSFFIQTLYGLYSKIENINAENGVISEFISNCQLEDQDYRHIRSVCKRNSENENEEFFGNKLFDDLSKNWISFTSTSTYCFWENEFIKHISCILKYREDKPKNSITKEPESIKSEENVREEGVTEQIESDENAIVEGVTEPIEPEEAVRGEGVTEEVVTEEEASRRRMVNYFKKAIDLYNKVIKNCKKMKLSLTSLAKKLNNDEILINKTEYTNFKKCNEKGKTVVPKCQGEYLAYIDVCFNIEKDEIIDCPKELESNCDSSV